MSSEVFLLYVFWCGFVLPQKQFGRAWSCLHCWGGAFDTPSKGAFDYPSPWNVAVAVAVLSVAPVACVTVCASMRGKHRISQGPLDTLTSSKSPEPDLRNPGACKPPVIGAVMVVARL